MLWVVVIVNFLQLSINFVQKLPSYFLVFQKIWRRQWITLKICWILLQRRIFKTIWFAALLKHHVFLLQAAKKTMVGHLYYLAMQHNALLAAEKFSKCPQNFTFYLKLTDKKMWNIWTKKTLKKYFYFIRLVTLKGIRLGSCF